MHFPRLRHILKLAAFLAALPVKAQVPNLIPQQGRVAVNGVNFDGTGQFKFALVNAAGTVTYWSNDGSSAAGSQPAAAVTLQVTKGLYALHLGDNSLTNMTAVPASVFTHADLRLRVWFNNGPLGFQQLTPDQRLAPNGYLPDGAVTSAKLADGAVTSAKLTPGATPPPVLVTGATQNAAANMEYVATGSGTTTFVLPDAAAPGDRITVSSGALGGLDLYDPYGWIPRDTRRGWIALATSADGTKLLASAGNSPLLTSTDGGITWTLRELFRAWGPVASSADGTKLVAAVVDGQIYTSPDSGTTWIPRDAARKWVSVASSADGTKLIASVQNGQLYTSTDSGVTWTPRESSRYWHGVASSADGSKLIAAAWNDLLYTSVDSGVTWTPHETTREWWSVASSADGSKLVATVLDGRIYTSTDSGITWTPRYSGAIWYSIASSADGSRLVTAVLNGQIHISTDSGVTWTQRESNRYWSSVASSADGTRLFATDNFGGFIYTSGAVIYSAQANATVPLTFTAAGWTPMQTPGPWAQTGGNLTYNTGNVGIGTANPLYPFSMGRGFADTKISLWDDGPGTPAYGMGIRSGQFRFHLDRPVARFSFLNGPDGAEVMTVQGDGRVGIGAVNPGALLQVGDAGLPNSRGLMRFGSSSPSRSAWREWEIGVPGGTEDVNGKNYSFVIDDLLGGNGQPEVAVRYDTGFVGIGTASPEAALEVDTRGAGRVQIRNEGNFVPGLNVTGGPLPGYLRFRNAFEIWPNDAGNAPGRMDIRNTTGAPTITMDGGAGSIGIGRTAASNRLEVEGNASKVTAGSWLANSDRRIKTDIKPVTGALETIEKVRPVTFRYTEDYRKSHPDIADVPYYNVIAQEFREVFPNAVKSSGEKLPDGSEILQVDTYPATITAIAAIKELKAENEALKQRLAALEDIVRSLQPAGGKRRR